MEVEGISGQGPAAGSAVAVPSERATATLLDALDGYAAVTDADRRICYLNRPPSGRAIGRYLGEDFIRFAAEAQQSLLRAAADRVLAGAPPVELEVREADTDRWHRLRIAGIAEAGAVTGLAIHARDIDDEKRAEADRARLRAGRRAPRAGDGAASDAARSLIRLELLVDALPVLISYVDRDRRYQYNNAAYERWFGESRVALRGRTLHDVLGAAAYEEIRGYVDAVLTGEAVTFESTVPYRNAGVRPVIARYVPDVTGGGAVQGFFALVEDITERRAAERVARQREEEVRQLQKLEALGQLAGGIAHEFNNLLQTVVTGCTAILATVGEETPVGRRCARIHRAVQRGSSLTRQLLAFSRRSELTVGPVDLDALVADMEPLLARLIGSRVQVEVGLTSGATIVADAGQIQQVLMNLAINARDAMPDGGHLRIRTERTEITAAAAAAHGGQSPGTHAVLSVVDTGTGMDEATRARIFEPFFTTKPAGKGTGLGLATVYGIVRQLGGHVDVDTAPGQGTTFRLYIPVTAAPTG